MNTIQPLCDEIGEVQVGSDEANVSMSLEHSNLRVGSQFLHHAGLFHRWDEPIAIGGKEKRRHRQRGQSRADIVAHQDAKSIDVTGLRGLRGEFQKTPHFGLCGVPRMESKRGYAAHQLHRLPGDNGQSSYGKPKPYLRLEEREGIQHHQMTNPVGVSDGKAHGESSSKGLAHQGGGPPRSRGGENAAEIVHQFLHRQRVVAQPIGHNAVPGSEEQRTLTVEERSGPVDSRHVQQDRPRADDSGAGFVFVTAR